MVVEPPELCHILGNDFAREKTQPTQQFRKLTCYVLLVILTLALYQEAGIPEAMI